jgi:hypothetical protein
MLEKKTIRFRGIGTGDNVTLGEFHTIVSIDKRDYPVRVHAVSDTLMKHELLISTDFLKSVQITMNAGEIISNASESIPENKEVREMCQLDLDSDEVNNIDMTHMLNAERRDATESLVDECKPEKRVSCELGMLAMKEAQWDDVDIKKIFDLVKARGIDGYVARGSMPFREVEPGIRTLLDKECRNSSIR